VVFEAEAFDEDELAASMSRIPIALFSCSDT
jgi:hypothetical protein